MKRTKSARRIALAATLLIIIALAVAGLLSGRTVALLREYDAALKFVGLGLGPLLAILGFFWGRVDKAELKDLSEELGSARKAAEIEKSTADAARADVASKVDKIRALESDLATIADAGRLWKLRKNDPFPEYKGWKFDPEGAKVVSIALFKGGVGKTHLTANFAAYVSEKQQKPVLLIDLDYQGSLSTAVLQAAGIEPVGSSVDALFDEGAGLKTIIEKRIHLASHGPGVALNDGNGLAKVWLVPSDYTLAQVESRLLVQRVIHEGTGIDERYRLAHVLLNPSVRRDYAMILIDTPPRMTLGTVNAFVASHAYVVPTILDRVSSEAVKPFLQQVQSLKADLSLDLRLAGIVGTMTRQATLTGREPSYRDEVEETARAIVGQDEAHVIQQNLPRKSSVTRDDDLGYFLNDNAGTLRDNFYDPIFDELWSRIFSPQNRVN